MRSRHLGIHLMVAAACAAILVGGAIPAAAHGPCNCTGPAAGVPGQRLVSQYPTVRVVWNPIASDGFVEHVGLASEHVAGQPRVVLLERAKPGLAAFRIPATAPGRYMVLLYDGEEGGQHYSWDYVTVRPASRPSPVPSPHATTVAAQPPPPAGGLSSLAVAGLMASAVALLGAGLIVLMRRRQRA